MNLELIQESTSLAITLVVVFVPASETLYEFIMWWGFLRSFFSGHSAVYENMAWQIMEEVKDWFESNENVFRLS